MKQLVFFLVFSATLASFSSCTKAKTPVSVVDPNCSDTVSFAQDIQPIIVNNCISCHDAGNSTGYTFTSHALISGDANDMIGAMRNEGFQLMPEGGPALPDSLISLFQCWMQNGKLDN